VRRHSPTLLKLLERLYGPAVYFKTGGRQ
jgi:hypothetical protein